MQGKSHTANLQWPTLEARLTHALTSREEALRQLQTTMQLTPLALAVLERKRRDLLIGPKKTAG